MKYLKNILCVAVMILFSLLVSACKDIPPQNNVNVSFATLKTIVEESEEITSWQGLNVTTLNANKEVVGSFKSTKQVTRTSDVVVDFIHEKGNHKIYCDDNVRYYYEDARKYLDEGEFNYSEYENTLLSECLAEVEEFFKDDKNTENLLNSSKLDKEDNIEYTFEILLDTTTNKKLVATYICDKHSNLIMIKVSITEDNKEKIETEIKENTEIVITPEWFDSNDYKTELTYEQVKAIVEDENLLNGWDSAEWFLPPNYDGGEEDKIFVSSKSQNITYIVTDSTKEFFDGNALYQYNNAEPSKSVLTAEEKTKYTFDYKSQEFKMFAYSYFFYNESVYRDYYVASKKYEKDITVISYKYFGEANGVVFESICSLIYDTQDNLIEIRCYVKQESQEYANFEMNLYMKKLNSVEIPEWFNQSDFENI